MTGLAVLLGERNPLRRRRTGAGVGPRRPVTFPATRLKSRVQVALGADLSADPLTWPWADITDKARFDLGVSLSTGRRDEASTVTTGSAQIKLDNRDGRFSRRNPLSPYYGLLSKNTPIWATVDAGNGEKTRLEMFVNEWPTWWTDKSANDSTVTIQCAGILRRLAQGEVPKPALRRTILASNQPTPTAYWPCEDGTLATSVASGLAGGSPMSGTPVFGDGFGGSTGSLNLGEMTPRDLTATVPLPSSAGFQVECVAQSSLGVDANLIHIESGSFGAVLTLVAALADGQPHHLAARFVQNGSNVDVSVYRDGVLSSTTPFAWTLAPSVTLFIPVGAPGARLLAHIAVYDFASMDVPTMRAPAADAFTGEQSHVRMTRLSGEEGVLFETLAATSAVMGPQGIGNFIGLMRECETADGGALYEKRWGLAYKSLNEYYNQPVGLALDFDQGHIGDLPEPADDDQRTRNRWTVSRANGSEFTVEETSGPMGTGTQGPGLYDDSVTLNIVDEDQLPNQANWRVHTGTIDEDRWPNIGLNFTASPELIDAFTALGFGARVTAANPPDQMPPDPLDLIIEGYTERWDPILWTVSLNCSPASVYRVAVAGSTDGSLGRVDAAASTLAADATDVATTISVASPAALWRTGAVSFDIGVAGERMTVTNISGGSSPQTFTVTRSVNGVVKAQPAATAGQPVRVSLWRPAVVAL